MLGAYSLTPRSAKIRYGWGPARHHKYTIFNGLNGKWLVTQGVSTYFLPPVLPSQHCNVIMLKQRAKRFPSGGHLLQVCLSAPSLCLPLPRVSQRLLGWIQNWSFLNEWMNEVTWLLQIFVFPTGRRLWNGTAGDTAIQDSSSIRKAKQNLLAKGTVYYCNTALRCTVYAKHYGSSFTACRLAAAQVLCVCL